MRTKKRLYAALLMTAVVAALLAPAGQAATRKPFPTALAARPFSAPDPLATPSSSPAEAGPTDATDASGYREYSAGAGYAVEAASSAYGEAEVQSVVDVLGTLEHGPELSQLSVYVATPEEIASICGATVVACYMPQRERMIVSGVDRPAAGVPRDFAIAHEYGHHIANSQSDTSFPAIATGTIRWATYERVCQYSRARKLFPGDQGAHYFEDPEEAFAETYAHLSDPDAKVSWQYSPLLRPSAASLAKIRADVSRPWNGPVTVDWSGSVQAPPAGSHLPSPPRRTKGGSLSGAEAVGPKPWIASRFVSTPLDGTVSVSVTAPADAEYSVVLRDAESGRALARGVTDAAGSANLSYGNCGRSALQLEVGSIHGSGPFTANIVRP